MLGMIQISKLSLPVLTAPPIRLINLLFDDHSPLLSLFWYSIEALPWSCPSVWCCVGKRGWFLVGVREETSCYVTKNTDCGL